MYAHKNSGRATAAAPEHRRAAARPAPSAIPASRAISAAWPDWPSAVAATWASRARPSTTSRVAAELHDVGKVAIPDAILNKPGPLDDDEWAFMRRHTLIGERIVAAAPALRPGRASWCAPATSAGTATATPTASAGEDIPLGARIVAVCDAYDAIVADRPYRRGRSADAALAELRRCAGTQFDPRVVAAFAAALAAERRGHAAAAV